VGHGCTRRGVAGTQARTAQRLPCEHTRWRHHNTRAPRPTVTRATVNMAAHKNTGTGATRQHRELAGRLQAVWEPAGTSRTAWATAPPPPPVPWETGWGEGVGPQTGTPTRPPPCWQYALALPHNTIYNSNTMQDNGAGRLQDAGCIRTGTPSKHPCKGGGRLTLPEVCGSQSESAVLRGRSHGGVPPPAPFPAWTQGRPAPRFSQFSVPSMDR
jgi:hypothetical protein